MESKDAAVATVPEEPAMRDESTGAEPLAAPRRRLRGALVGAAKFGLALLLALASVEGTVRALGWGVPARGPDNNLPLRVRIPAAEAPGLVDTLRPNSSGKVLYPGFGERPERWVHYAINADGFRDRSYERVKPLDAYRIVVLGDSVAYGTGVQLEDTLPKQLEQELARLHPGRAIEVMNCGVYAHNTRQQVAWFEYAALEFAPDLVLVVSTITDASGQGIPKRESAETREQRLIAGLGLTSGLWEAGSEHTAAQRVTMALRRRSRLADLVAHRLYGILRGRLVEGSYAEDWLPQSPGHAQVERSLARLGALSRKHDFDVVVAMYPTLTSLGDRYPYATQTAALAAICATHELPFIDLLEPLAGHEASRLHAHAHDRHPNATAHGLVAGWLAPRLETWIGATDNVVQVSAPLR